MKYLKVKWQHHFSDEPIETYSEINQFHWEIRKVELFDDGTTSYASPFHHTGRTWLVEAPIPDLAEINADFKFEGEWISHHDFEQIWLMSRHSENSLSNIHYANR